MAHWAAERHLFNAYGPTEATVWATVATCRPDDDGITIGKPVTNVTCAILDESGNPQPVGARGELHLGGRGLARAYHARPALTAARFVPDPYSSAAGARLYRTGDLARYRDDGAIEFLGRLDAQVKLRGFRIEPDEIEAVLAGHPHIRVAAVMPRAEAGDDPHLVGYLVFEDGQTVAEEALRHFLETKLPAFMIPARFVPLTEMPRLPNDKIDRRRLPQCQAADLPQGKPYVAPRNDLEASLCAIYAQVLEREQVGIHDDFFELGGHSLLATRTASMIAAELRVDMAVNAIFDHPTAALLAGHITDQRIATSAGDDLEALLADLDNLSDEEASRALARERTTNAAGGVDD
jgi:hypothetical protein